MSALNPIKSLVVFSNGLTHGQERRRDDLLLEPVKRAGHETQKLETNWFADVPYDERLEKDIDRVRGWYQVKGRLALVGSSAGSSHAANIYGALAGEFDELYFIGMCGRLARGNLRPRDWRTIERAAHIGNKPSDIKPPSPGFVASVDYFQSQTLPILQNDLDYRDRVHLLHQIWDEVVPQQTMRIDGIESSRVRTITHGLGIFAASRHVPQVIKKFESRG